MKLNKKLIDKDEMYCVDFWNDNIFIHTANDEKEEDEFYLCRGYEILEEIDKYKNFVIKKKR